MVDDLTVDEREALVALARHLVLADGEVSNSEVFEMLRIEVALGPEAWRDAKAATDADYRDRARVLQRAARVERAGVQRRILSLLEALAEGDGVHVDEAALLAALRGIWTQA